jgi:YVTN family beta-propeller protein
MKKSFYLIFVITFLLGITIITLKAQADPTLAYVSNESDDKVRVIDTVTNSVVATVSVGNTPEGVAVTPDGLRAYVANNNTTTIFM